MKLNLAVRKRLYMICYLFHLDMIDVNSVQVAVISISVVQSLLVKARFIISISAGRY